MKKIFALSLLSLILVSCAKQVELETFSGADFSFSYPKTYVLKRAATRYVLQDENAESAVTIYRYLAKDPEEVIAQMAAVEQNCKYSSGGVKFGGYKSYKVELDESVPDAKCTLEGDLITNGENMLVLFITNNSEAKEALETLKDSFTFAN